MHTGPESEKFNYMITRILEAFPEGFIRKLRENTDAAFIEAERIFKATFEYLGQESILGQIRHALCEEALYKTAVEFGISVKFSDTCPKGAKYVVCYNDGVYFIRSNVQTHCGPPRSAKFRKDYAKHNKWLMPSNADLFEEIPEPSEDKLCIMFVTSAFNIRKGNPFTPAYMGIGVPGDNSAHWIELISIEEMIALYNDRQIPDESNASDDGGSRKENGALDEYGKIIDRALPTLKKGVKKEAKN